ncbi:TIGR01458 family HAD-type hydrolase [Bacterioplanoides pacificum]|uniref:Haloacid dehalogenase-like hydrolase domain-containing protein 2 n=1 Tax=Bacterioplanoides pacificum TaxID=1171596 RepID=A0ABV7VM78_9GAMM
MQAILFDLEGVIYQQKKLIDGAAETMEWVRKQHIPHLFVTNTTTMSQQQVSALLTSLGVYNTPEQILTPAVTTRDWLQQHPGQKMAVFVPDAIRHEFDDVVSFNDSEAAGVIVGDLGANWNYFTLNHAFRILTQSPETVLVALGMSRYHADDAGLHMDAGPFIKALEFASGKSALVMGKPASSFFQEALQKLNADASQVLMVGDDLMADVIAAKNCGIHGCLVRTGKYQSQDERGVIKAEFVIDSIRDLPTLWVEGQLSQVS